MVCLWSAVYLLNISLDISARHLREKEKGVFDKSRLLVTYDSVFCLLCHDPEKCASFHSPYGAARGLF